MWNNSGFSNFQFFHKFFHKIILLQIFELWPGIANVLIMETQVFKHRSGFLEMLWSFKIM